MGNDNFWETTSTHGKSGELAEIHTDEVIRVEIQKKGQTSPKNYETGKKLFFLNHSK